MHQISRNNLQEFCRTCLKSLQKRRRQERETTFTDLEVMTVLGNDSDSINSYNLSLLPQLRKLFVLFTSLDISEEDVEYAYPRSLCQLCYDKMIDFQEFRKLAINSAEVLYKIVNSLDDDTIKSTEEAANLQPKEENAIACKTEPLESCYQNRDDDDDQLLLPELADMLETSIRTEPIDSDISKNSSTVVVKTEIESECDKEENNALGTSHNSISDDADDEEHTLRNETNTTRRLRKNVSSTVEGRNGTNTSRRLRRNVSSTVEGRNGTNTSRRLRKNVSSTVEGRKRKRDRSKKALKCPLCDKQVYKQIYLDAHIRAVHEGHDKPFLCTQCQKSFTRYGELHRHIQSKHLPEDNFSRKGPLHTHIQSQHLPEDNFSRKGPLHTIIQSEHLPEDNFSRNDQLHAHIQSQHLPEDNISRNDQLHAHIQSQHLPEDNFSCDFIGCDAVFKSRNTWETHRQVVHTTLFPCGLQEMLELHNTELSNEIGTDHICYQCFKKYSSKRALNEHLKRHAQIKEHVCKVCGAAKVTRTELLTHMRTHKPNLEKFKCSICPQEFNHKNAISRHVRVVHEGQRRFPCSYCPKRFGTRNSQVCHERLHTGERPFNCKLCNKRYAQMEGLKSHMKTHDKNLRKYVCSFCTQRFITRKNLIDHEKRHQSDKPHICNACGRGFFSKADLGVHKRAHTDEELRKKTERRRRYETFHEAGDSLGEQATESAGEGNLGYSSSQSSN